jgi:hypothetical protein
MVTAREVAGTLALCVVAAGITVGVVVGSPHSAQSPAPVFTPTVFCPSGQHLVKIGADGMPVCASPVKRPPFDFQPGRSS